MAIKGVFTALNWHQPILQFYISLIGLLLVSAFSYHYFETPLRRKISRFKLFKK
jgi:peptidoglycan/LPS O-acetylase OafA/YrhL